MRSYVSKRGRNVEVAESAVRQSKSFTADEALAQHLVVYIAKDDNDPFQHLEGKTITHFNGEKEVLHLVGKPMRLYQPSLRQQILSWLMDPSLAGLLFAIGMLALYAEFNHPGAVVPGVIGFIAILVALFAMHLLPTRYESLALLAGAFVLFALEAKMQTHGVLTAGGILMMILGLLPPVDGPTPAIRFNLSSPLST